MSGTLPRHGLAAVAATCLTLGVSMAGAQSSGPEGQTPTGRPPSLGVQANIVFLYYKDIPRAQRFYEDVIGLTLTVDQGFAKIYQVSPTSFIGLVDEAQGLHRASEAKAGDRLVRHRADRPVARLPGVAGGVKLRGPDLATRRDTRRAGSSPTIPKAISWSSSAS